VTSLWKWFINVGQRLR